MRQEQAVQRQGLRATSRLAAWAWLHEPRFKGPLQGERDAVAASVQLEGPNRSTHLIASRWAPGADDGHGHGQPRLQRPLLVAGAPRGAWIDSLQTRPRLRHYRCPAASQRGKVPGKERGWQTMRYLAR